MDMQFVFWGYDYRNADDVVPPMFATTGGYNPFGYSAPDVDREIRRLDRLPAGLTRDAGWAALADRIARRDAPIVVLGDWQTARLHSARVHNVVMSATNGPDLSLLDLGD